MLQWSKYFQNPLYMEMTRKFLIMEEMQPHIRKFCHIEKGMKVLDVGCGTGFFSRFLSGNTSDLEVTGVDADEAFIGFAREKSRSQNQDIAFIQGNALGLPFQDNSYDVVVSHTFLTSISDPKKALEEMQRVCKEGGFICSLTAMSFLPQMSYKGNYPKECYWYFDYKKLEGKLWDVYETLNPTDNYSGGIPTALIPELFLSNGLQNISAYPVGKVFSLSNEAIPAESRKEYIQTMYEADMQKADTYKKLTGFYKYISEGELEEYLRLAELQRDYLIHNAENNTIWEWEGGSNCLIVGRNKKQKKRGSGTESAYLIDTKFKDSLPEETVNQIQKLLGTVGIRTRTVWLDSQVKGCYSNRIELQESTVGQNGKGMTKEFALASGYAELMERIQTGYFYVGSQDKELEISHGFTYIPEECYLSVDEILDRDEKWLDRLYHAVLERSREYFTKRSFLECLAYRKYEITEKLFIGIPFCNLKTGERAVIPKTVLEDYYATNGTCAGNSPTEAIVQGLSEIVERHHNLKIHNEGITPPTIPNGYLEKFHAIYGVISSIRENRRYGLIIKDCSLGTGFPVVASALIDKEKQTYIVKFGAHPVFEIALERSMTEMFQGRNLENAAAVSGLLYKPEDAAKADIVHNVLKNATGKYHYHFFEEHADHLFIPFEDRSGMSNEQLYQYAVNFFDEKGYEIYIRNASYLGFYTFQILVPSYSEIYNNGILRLKEKSAHEKAVHTVFHLSEATEKECKSLITYLKYKENFALENTLPFLVKLPLKLQNGVKEKYFIYLLACLKLQDYKEAARICGIILYFALQTSEAEYFRCMSMYLNLMEEDGKGNMITVLNQFHDPSVVNAVAADLKDFDRMIRKYGFICNDYQCGQCENNLVCDYEKVKDMMLKLKTAYKKAAPLEQRELFCKKSKIHDTKTAIK
ncbi:MAG: YcaO-like family protein [Eubacteriales bacterium]|nr:YcaO-like family protein [Eubacteriales bacterium]